MPETIPNGSSVKSKSQESPLPLEIIGHIFGYLPQGTLKTCRLLNQTFSPLATAHAFKLVRLEAFHHKSYSSFTQIAQEPRLLVHVREISIDTWIGAHFKYRANRNYEFPHDFLIALPSLRFYPNVTALHIRFTEYCGNDDRGMFATTIEETYDFRFNILSTIFDCVTGTWTSQKETAWREYLDEQMSLEGSPDSDNEKEDQECFNSGITTSMQLKTLIVTNLVDYDDPRLKSLESFKQVMALPSLTKLKLLVACEREESAPEMELHFSEKYEFFELIDSTWLQPSLCRQLEVLSLYYRDCWGWAPRCDFRRLNPGHGQHDAMAGLPNLRVLALGNFVFTHDWQIDWIASLGASSASGGLQELYLDDCPIMWHAKYYGKLDTGVQVVGKDDKGKDIEVSNSGYPYKDTLIDTQNLMAPQEEEMEWSKRWSDVLTVWREKMNCLKVFKMGSGPWHGEHAHLIVDANQPFDHDPSADGQDRNSPEQLASSTGPPSEQVTYEKRMASYNQMITSNHTYQDQLHITYDCPEPPRQSKHNYGSWYFAKDWSEDLSKEQEQLLVQPIEQIVPRLKNGVGLSQRRKHILQYTTFDIGIGPSQWTGEDFKPPRAGRWQGDLWIEEFNEIEMQQYEAVLRRDEQALSELMTIVDKRRLGQV